MPAGRPRSFDIEQALDRALSVFWQKGFEGASLHELTKAMGINRPSLYAAFGNKEQLFRKALNRYLEGPACHMLEALDAPTARGVAEHWLRSGIALVTSSSNPRGCLVVQGALACGDEGETLRRELSRLRAAGESALTERFHRALDEGDLPPECDPANLARFITTLSYGLTVQAQGGATYEQLEKVAELALQNWPMLAVVSNWSK